MTRHSGFTLVEVTVAMLLGSMVLLGAQAILSNLSNRERALRSATIVTTREANGRQVLRELVGNVEIGTPGTTPLAGDLHSVRFSSWCDAPAGWQERCNVGLAFDTAGGYATLVAHIGAQPVDLVTGFERGSFRYLQNAGSGGVWLDQWGGGVTAPLGIGAVLEYADRADTLILRIGPRG